MNVFKQAWAEFNELMQQERDAAAQRKLDAMHNELVEKHKAEVFTNALIANRVQYPRWLSWLNHFDNALVKLFSKKDTQ